jgi:hypothetical protein
MMPHMSVVEQYAVGVNGVDETVCKLRVHSGVNRCSSGLEKEVRMASLRSGLWDM